MLALFFLPYILPVTTVTAVWEWTVTGLADLAAPLDRGRAGARAGPPRAW